MLSAYNYKVDVAVGAKPTELKRYLSLEDIGAGPNLIRADCVPPEILANVNRDRRIVNLASAAKHKLHTIGVVSLWMDIGGCAFRQPFVVIRRRAAGIIIGCTLLDDHAESLQIRRKVLILADGTVVPIRRLSAGKSTVVRTRERIEVTPLPPKSNQVHVAQRIVLPPQSETIVKVVCGRTGPVVLHPRPRLHDKRQVSLTNGFTVYGRTDRSPSEWLTSAQASEHSLKPKSWVLLTLHLIRYSRLTYLRTTLPASPQNVSALMRSVCLILKSLGFWGLVEMPNAEHLSAMQSRSCLCKVVSSLVSRSLSSRHPWTISTCCTWTRSYGSIFANCFPRSPLCGTEILAPSSTY